MFLVFDWWLDVIWLKSHRNATNCIDFNIVIRILNTPVSAKMAQGQRKWHVVRYDILTPGSKYRMIYWPRSQYIGGQNIVSHRHESIAFMMTSWNGIIFRVTGPLWGESTRRFNVFFDLRLNKPLHKQLRRRWFQAHLWRHCNVFIMVNTYTEYCANYSCPRLTHSETS